jgi:glutathionyl-hydroquinone reductase
VGLMIDGLWHTDEGVRARQDGSWQRTPSILLNWVTPDGAPGPTGRGGFPAAANRYHLYVAWNCPWAHRALLTRTLKGLEQAIPISVVAPRRTDDGWVFAPAAGYTDDLFGASALSEIYARSEPDYTGRVTVPVLWDTEQGRIVSNESADIVRMLGSAFDGVGANGRDFYPLALRPAIDAWNDRIHRDLNNGVYRAGFAESQAAYDEAVAGVFETLDAIEEQLGSSHYLAGDHLSEADIRLFPTLARFDVGYWSAFKCNLRRLIDYPCLWDYARTIYRLPGVAETVHFDIYRRGYHSPSPKRNPHGIVPLGPEVNWNIDEPARLPAFPSATTPE